MALASDKYSNTKHIGLVIVDGVGFKNFVLSDVLAELNTQFKHVTIFSGLPNDVYKNIFQNNITVIELPVYTETGDVWFFRKLKELAHLQRHKKNNAGIRYNLLKNKNIANSKRGWMTRLAFRITAICNSEFWIDRFYKLQENAFKSSETFKIYKDFLIQANVDLLFFTHQRPPYIALLESSAKALNIPTTAFIFSWDNLPSKGRMASNFDTFLVWSDLMKMELMQFYPNITETQIEVVGTPQFEPYILERYSTSFKDFKERFQLTPDLKTICYSCGDVSTSLNDPLYIKIITEAIQEKTIPEINFIVRTSPAEDGSRFDELKKNYPNIIWNYPNWKRAREHHPEMWSQRMPSVEDLKDLRAIVTYADLNINMCSTMSLDSMIFGKAVVNVAFGNKENGLYHDQKYLEYAHYKRVIKSGAVRLAKSETELIEAINQSLEFPVSRLKCQTELLNLQISKPLKGTSKRIAQILYNWA